MARIRSIKPEFPQSESTGRLSRDGRLLFILLWTVVDDSGRARGNSRMLASLLYPYDKDAPDLIEAWLVELENEGMVRRYIVDGSAYLEICNWLKHQKIDKPTPSRLPSPRDSLAKPRELPAPDLDLGSGSGEEGKEPSAPSASRHGAGLNGHDPEKDATDPVVERIPLCDGSEFSVRQSFVAELDRLYPAVDPAQTLREMRGWCIGNPKRTKTVRGVKGFITSWFAREQDRQSRRPA